jgi:RNA polymerase sigma-70 factor (ECF subfamily)
MTAAIGSMIEDGAALVAAASTGDEAAFERLVALHHEDLRRICHVVTGDPVGADEAVQAAWTIAWQKLRTLRDPARVRPWLASIAINEARRAHRSHGRRGVVEIHVAERSAAAGAAADPAAGISGIDLRNALARLSADDRSLLALRYVAGFDSNEIAAATGRSASGTRSRLARLLQRLQGELSDE